MVDMDMLTYEKIYFSLWEAAQRYSRFTQFRVIGESHDERMIPMIEIGRGQECVFCISGIKGTDQVMPGYLLDMVMEYCQTYEAGWKLEQFYDVRALLDEIRLCFIPLLNPDGFEICIRGCSAVRNPIYRQMLRMQKIRQEDYWGNGRGVELSGNFPTAYYTRKRIHQEPASENETRALIRIFQEYRSKGLLSFCQEQSRIIYYKQPQSFLYNQKSSSLARHLQSRTKYRLEKYSWESGKNSRQTGSTGSLEQYYGEVVRQPALWIQQPGWTEKAEEGYKREYKEIHVLPLEYLYALLE